MARDRYDATAGVSHWTNIGVLAGAAGFIAWFLLHKMRGSGEADSTGVGRC